MRVLQIGAGPTGVSVFRQLYPILSSQNEVLDYVIADENEPGSGLAFGSAGNSHILNLPATTMSLDPNNPLEFYNWRARSENIWNDGTYDERVWGEFPPRRLFGKYVSSTLQTLLDTRENAIFIKRKVQAISELKGPNKFLVYYEGGQNELFDKVILCIGHARKKPLFDPNLSNYFCSPYELSHLPSDASVGIIGSRLTAIDAALSLEDSGHKGSIYFVSRSGALPKVFDENKKPYSKDLFIEKLLELEYPTLNDIFVMYKEEIKSVMGLNEDSVEKLLFCVNSKETFEKELELLGKQTDWQNVLLSSYDVVDNLWEKLSNLDKELFLEKYYGLWMTFLAAYPKSSALRIKNMMDSGQLSLIGEVKSVTQNGKTFSIFSSDKREVTVDYIVDARGVGYSEDDMRCSLLLSSLLDNEMISVNKYGGIKVNTASYEAVTRFGIVKNFHVIGDLTKGEFLSTTDVGRCVSHSVKMASYHKDSIY